MISHKLINYKFKNNRVYKVTKSRKHSENKHYYCIKL